VAWGLRPPHPPRKERRTTAVWSVAAPQSRSPRPPRPARLAVERLRNKMRGAPVPARSIAGTDTPLRSESRAEAAGISRPGRAARGWSGALTIALRGDRSIVTAPEAGVPPAHPHGSAKKDKLGRDGKNIAAHDAASRGAHGWAASEASLLLRAPAHYGGPVRRALIIAPVRHHAPRSRRKDSQAEAARQSRSRIRRLSQSSSKLVSTAPDA